jgi:hypothetical protein
MRPIPLKLRKQMEADPMMHACIYNDHYCQNEFGWYPVKAEWEHCFIYAGKQINEWWAIIGVCWYHHRGKGLNKNFNRYRALIRLSEAELEEVQKKYPKQNWRQMRDRLRIEFGQL